MQIKERLDVKIGKKYNRWTVVGKEYTKISTSNNRSRHRVVPCICECGTKRDVRISKLISGESKSCGCYKIEVSTKHGLSGNIFYATYNSMMFRCYNPNSEDYHNYGERGIIVCPEWYDNPKAFIKWAEGREDYREGYHLDRINNEGIYEPSNCRFVSHADNQKNKRNVKLSLEKANEIRKQKEDNPNISIKELAQIWNVSATTISKVLKNEIWI